MFIICCKVTKSRVKNQINLDFYAYIIYPHYIGIFNIHLRITILFNTQSYNGEIKENVPTGLIIDLNTKNLSTCTVEGSYQIAIQ